jgi:hypothetical protein
MTDEEAKADGLTIACPNGHEEWMHPDEPPSADPFFCGECGHVFGTFADVHARLFTGGTMLAETLSKKP